MGMAQIRLVPEATPAAPIAGNVTLFVDTADTTLKAIDSDGTVRHMGTVEFTDGTTWEGLIGRLATMNAGPTGLVAPDAPTQATSVIGGTSTHAAITVTADLAGFAGNDYTIEVATVATHSADLDVDLTSTAITITLGNDSSGDPDATKNTGDLVAAAISALEGLTAAVTTAGDPLDADDEDGPNNFTGGNDGTSIAMAGQVEMQGGLILCFNLPDSDPEKAGQLYTDGTVSAGTPQVLMVSGGPSV
jgi:hypothetical protein